MTKFASISNNKRSYVAFLLFWIMPTDFAHTSTLSYAQETSQKLRGLSSTSRKRDQGLFFAQSTNASSQGVDTKNELEFSQEDEDEDEPSNEIETDDENIDDANFEFDPDDDSSEDDQDSEGDDTTNTESEDRDQVDKDTDKIAELKRDAQGAFAHDPFRSLSFLLSPGSERISGRGGSSQYNGDSQYLGLDLDFSIKIPKWKGYSVLAAAHFHEFVTKNFVRVRSENGASSGESLQFQRYNFYTYLQRKVYQYKESHHFQLSLGVLASQIPVLETLSLTSGSAKLDNYFYTGALLGGLYELVWSQRGRMQIQLFYLLSSFNSNKSMEKNLISLGVKHQLIKRLFLRTHLRWTKESASYSIFCPADSGVNCSSKSKIESQMTNFLLGLGFDF